MRRDSFKNLKGLHLKMLISVNDLAFLCEILSDDPMADFIAGARKARVAQIDMGLNMLMTLLEEMQQFDQARLNRKMRKRFSILLEEFEEAADLMADNEKHPFIKELEDELQKQNFTSEEQLQEFISARNININNIPQNDLGGLTPAQLQNLFSRGWWEHEGFVKLSADIPQVEAAAVPMVNNIGIMLRSVADRSGKKGLKATVTGKLPRSVINDVIPFLIDTEYHDSFHLGCGKKAFNEDDLYCLMMQRHISEVAGLLKLRDNHWKVTPKGLKLIEPANAAALLVRLFGSMFHDFNLAFLDRYDSDGFLQHTMPYSLWRAANLPAGRGYSTTELAELVVHSEFRRLNSMPSFPGSDTTLGQRVAASRLFRPLSWAGWLKPITGKNKFDIEGYRITEIPGRIFQTPDLPEPKMSKA
jgi:hypothetical protein